MRQQFDEFGREIPDPTPAPMPPGAGRGFSLHDQIKASIKLEMSRIAEEAGSESFEEADDFDVEDEEGDFVSQYELTDAQVEMVEGVRDDDADPPPDPKPGKPVRKAAKPSKPVEPVEAPPDDPDAS